MMFEQFTVEEVNLMFICDMSSRRVFIDELKALLPWFEDVEMTEIAEGVLKKVEIMSDADFSALELYPEYEDYDEQEG